MSFKLDVNVSLSAAYSAANHFRALGLHGVAHPIPHVESRFNLVGTVKAQSASQGQIIGHINCDRVTMRSASRYNGSGSVAAAGARTLR